MKNERVCVLDVEATGLSAKKDRITEVGIVELFDFEPTGRYFHAYIYSGHEIPKIVVDLTGITNKFLKDKLPFSEIAKDMLDFIGPSMLVAHNSSYDESMINNELRICKKPQIPSDRFIDTLKIAREKYPGRKASQDAIMSRLGIDASMRDTHGAIVDAYLLSLMYKEMCQEKSELFDSENSENSKGAALKLSTAKPRPKKLESLITPQEAEAHRKFIIDMERESKKTSFWNY